MRKRKPDPRSGTAKPSHDDVRRDAPAFAAYLVLLIRMLAFLTLQLHIDPGELHEPADTSHLAAASGSEWDRPTKP